MSYRESAQAGWIAYGGFEFYELARQEYAGNNCIFAVGLVEGHPVDTHYIWLQKEEIGDPVVLLLRADELATLAWLASGALWSKLVKPNDPT